MKIKMDLDRKVFELSQFNPWKKEIEKLKSQLESSESLIKTLNRNNIEFKEEIQSKHDENHHLTLENEKLNEQLLHNIKDSDTWIIKYKKEISLLKEVIISIVVVFDLGSYEQLCDVISITKNQYRIHQGIWGL